MQITVQKIWPLDPTKKSGGFKATDGVNYYCEIGAYHLLSEGTTYEANPTPYVSKLGKSSYIMPKNWHPPSTFAGCNGASPPPTSPPYPPTATNQPAPPPVPNANGYVPEMERQGYIMCSVMMKILADAQTQSGNPPNTEDMALFAQCATSVWREHLKGKV